jgi:hypothetical protein
MMSIHRIYQGLFILKKLRSESTLLPPVFFLFLLFKTLAIFYGSHDKNKSVYKHTCKSAKVEKILL